MKWTLFFLVVLPCIIVTWIMAYLYLTSPLELHPQLMLKESLTARYENAMYTFGFISLFSGAGFAVWHYEEK